MESRTVTVGDRTLTVFEGEAQGSGEPMVRDLDLAAWLEYPRPRKIRELIARQASQGNIAPHVRPAVGRTSMPNGGSRETTVEEFWLTEPDALFIAAKSETPKANELLRGIIATFVAARRELAEKPVRVRAHGRKAPEPTEPEGNTMPEVLQQMAYLAVMGDSDHGELARLVLTAQRIFGPQNTARNTVLIDHALRLAEELLTLGRRSVWRSTDPSQPLEVRRAEVRTPERLRRVADYAACALEMMLAAERLAKSA